MSSPKIKPPPRKKSKSCNSTNSTLPQMPEIEHIEIKEEFLDQFYDESEVNQLDESEINENNYGQLEIKEENIIQIDNEDTESNPGFEDNIVLQNVQLHRKEPVPSSNNKGFFVYVTSCCKQACFMSFDERSQRKIYDSFYANKNKQLQDTFLIACVNQKPINRAVIMPKTKNRQFSWEYFFICEGLKINVCKQFLIKLLQISEGRMKTVLRFCQAGEIVAKEYRGCHPNRPRRIPNDVTNLMEKHWSLIPHTKNSNKKCFLHPDLTVRKLYELFGQYYTEQTGNPLKLAYCSYIKYFRTVNKYSLYKKKFEGCEFCNDCLHRLSDNENDDCKESYLSHIACLNNYMRFKQSTFTEVSNKRLLIEFNFVSDLQVPRLNNDESFYKHSLLLYLFNVHCFNTNLNTFYCLAEHEGSKNEDTICSFLYDFLSTRIQVDDFQAITLISDTLCSVVIARFISFLSCYLDVDITYVFQPQGHSYSQCEINAALYGPDLKKIDCIINIKDYFSALQSKNSTLLKAEVKMGGSTIRKWGEGLVSLCKDSQFCVSDFVKFIYDPSGTVSCFRNYDDYDCENFKILHVKKKNCEFQLEKIKPPGLSKRKQNDLKSLMENLNEDSRKWFRKILRNFK